MKHSFLTTEKLKSATLTELYNIEIQLEEQWDIHTDQALSTKDIAEQLKRVRRSIIFRVKERS